MQIDNYAISLFKDCPRKFQYRTIDNLEPKTANLPALFGIAIHSGLDQLYKDEDISIAFEAFGDAWKPYEGMDYRKLYTMERGFNILREYELHYLGDGETLYVETGFAVPIPGCEHILTGRIDRVKKVQERVKVQDHKTRSRALDSYCLNPNFQLLGYSFGVMNLMGLDYYPAVEANLIKVAKKFDPADFVLRMDKTPMENEMDEYFNTLRYYLQEIEDCSSGSNFPMKGSEFSCNWCEYRPLCEAPHMKERFVEEGVFVESMWKPY